MEDNFFIEMILRFFHIQQNAQEDCLDTQFLNQKQSTMIAEVKNIPFQFSNSSKSRFVLKSKKYRPQRFFNRKIKREVKLRRIHLLRHIRVTKNGVKWWSKLMRLYFGQVTEEDILNCWENTTSNIMLNFPQLRGSSKSYQQIFLLSYYHQYFRKENTVRFLFKGICTDNTTEDAQDLYELLIFSYEITPDQDNEGEECFIIDPPFKNRKLTTIKVNHIQQQFEKRSQYSINASLRLLATIDDTDTLFECSNYQQSLRRKDNSHIDRQLSLLTSKLDEIHRQNHFMWNKVHIGYQQQTSILYQLQTACSELNNLSMQLACRNRLLYFRLGFTDKTQDQLQQALYQLQVEEKRLLFSKRKKYIKNASYNDCKICFYPEIKQGNGILYCVTCLTSFHGNCYGLHQKEQEQIFLCDVCLWMEEQDYQYRNMERRPQCDICCSRKQFPMKMVDGLFYHPSCLFFFNFVNVKQFTIQLKQSIKAQLKDRVSQSKGSRCEYCLPESQSLGLRLKCSESTCSTQFHLICGYLRGCFFKVTRQIELDVIARCHFHSYWGCQDDEIRQVYLRRFFCNYNSIQKITENQFRPIFQSQKTEIARQIVKLRKRDVGWEDFDHVRKDQKRFELTECDQIDYKSMSIQKLLEYFTINSHTSENITNNKQHNIVFSPQQDEENDFC